MNWTKEQEAAISFPVKDGEKLSPDSRSATVTAAAGSGKTALLVERVIRILCDTDHRIPADRIAIMTFTRNAAEEFRRRMTDAVSVAAMNDPQNSYLADQLIRFKSAPICTINSFCLGIIREHAEAFGLPLSFSIIDEAKAAVLKSDALETAMEYFYSGEFDPRSRDLLFKTFSFKDDAALSAAIEALYNKVSSMTDPYDWMDGCVAAYISPEAAEKRFLPYYIDHIRRVNERMTGYIASIRSTVMSLHQEHADRAKLENLLIDDELKVHEAVSGLNKLSASPTLSELYRYTKSIGLNDKGVMRFKNLSCKDEHLKKRVESVRKPLKESYKSLTSCVPSPEALAAELPEQLDVTTSLVKLVKLYGEEYSRLKRESGYVDFSDCEQLLLEKLKADKQFRAEISERFRCIIVDEFQDTNDVQYEIFRMISDRENNLFFVGDIKQSIYAFRGGNPKIMSALCDPLLGQRLSKLERGTPGLLRKRNAETPVKLPTARKLKSGCRVFSLGAKHTPLPLNKNFRSRKTVLDTVNAMFTGVMTQKYGDVKYDHSTALTAGAEYPDAKASYTSELHLLQYDKERDKVLAEARYTASHINRMLKNGFPVKGEDGSVRPCRAGDFCILLRSMTHADSFKSELQSFGIPVNSGSGKSYLASEEITLILNYLKVIDNPLRDEELLQVLMSPVYMMTAQELAEARLGVLGMDKAEGVDFTPLYERYKTSTLFGCISACARASDTSEFGAFSEELSTGELAQFRELRREGHPKCVRFMDNLTKFRSFMANSSIERLIRKIYDDTDFFSVISTYEQSEQKLANIRLLMKYAADFENNGGGTLGDFLRYTDSVRDSSESFAEASTAESEENSVKLMTFHASKGLEMPIVILAELGKDPNKKDMSGPLVFNRSAGIGLRYVDIEQRYHYKPFGYTAITLAEQQKQKGEELRLLYVAMTRAKEKLIMIGKCSEGCEDEAKTEIFTDDFAMSGSSLLDWILASMLRYSDGGLLMDCVSESGDPLLEIEYSYAPPPAADEQAEAEAAEEAVPADEELAKRIAQSIAAEYKHSADISARSKFTVTEIAHMIDELATGVEQGGMVFMSKPSFVPKGTLTGKEVGDAYHHVMEHFPLDELIAEKVCDTDYAVGVLAALRSRGVLDDAEHKAVKPQHIAAFFNSALGQRMLKSRRIEREYPIFAEVPARDILVNQDGSTIIQGRADMFFIEEDGIVLVDYKSDTKENLKKELEAYSRQLSIYRRILPVMTGINVKEIYIYSFSCDMAVSV